MKAALSAERYILKAEKIQKEIALYEHLEEAMREIESTDRRLGFLRSSFKDLSETEGLLTQSEYSDDDLLLLTSLISQFEKSDTEEAKKDLQDFIELDSGLKDSAFDNTSLSNLTDDIESCERLESKIGQRKLEAKETSQEYESELKKMKLCPFCFTVLDTKTIKRIIGGND